MNGSPHPAGYWCEVRAEGLVYGTGGTASCLLGTFQTISPVLALRWLRGQAVRLADRLDPDPRHSPWARPFQRMPSVPVPDSPTALRAWLAEPGVQRAVRERVKAGHPLSAAFPDADCTFTLSLWPVRLPADRPGQPLPEPIPRRPGGRPPPGTAPGARPCDTRVARGQGSRIRSALDERPAHAPVHRHRSPVTP
ncbi:hypothetical protein V1J52_19655 [Streptomyces sp. TRM 70351]|uniref:hypothetical protein n=1 Tax=Streptomyces sp. TRM 70351 TaxID=3116552 RepID=UPI002E7B5BBA|nr:hypothetical protein [Streptomyces sp. TRM 70351]MEE1930370.1 hypothetical protein [Streptomyces sp. TRM 70351]